MKADLAQSDDLVACFNQGRPDPVGTRERDTVAILASLKQCDVKDVQKS